MRQVIIHPALSAVNWRAPALLLDLYSCLQYLYSWSLWWERGVFLDLTLENRKYIWLSCSLSLELAFLPEWLCPLVKGSGLRDRSSQLTSAHGTQPAHTIHFSQTGP